MSSRCGSVCVCVNELGERQHHPVHVVLLVAVGFGLQELLWQGGF